MKVKDLIDKLQKVDPETIVVQEGFDRSYERITRVYARTAHTTNTDDSYLGEWYEGQTLERGEKQVAVLVLE